MILGLLGQAGSGKDAVADFMVKNHSFVKVAFADPLKRTCKDVFGFTTEQLWGPSEKRNAPDPRWPHGAEQHRIAAEREFSIGRTRALDRQAAAAAWWEDEFVREHFKEALAYADEGWLSPRKALQRLGTEWGRWCSPDVWLEYALGVAKKLLTYPKGPSFYDPRVGMRSRYVSDPYVGGVVISDVRFANETKLLQKAGAKVTRIVRKTRPTLTGPTGLQFRGDELPVTLADLMKTAVLLSATASQHVSETEQQSLPGELFDYHLTNGGDSLELLEAAVAGLVATIRG